MAQLVPSETQYYFDLTNKQWWILTGTSDVWKELPNEEAYTLGLFKAVFSQECNFIDTDISQYDKAVSELLRDFDSKFGLNQHKSLDSVSNVSDLGGARVLTKDFSSETNPYESDEAKQAQKVKFEELDKADPKGVPGQGLEYAQTSTGSHQTSDPESLTVKSETSEGKDGGSENLLSQINDLIASTSQMKEICKAKELSGQNKTKAPNLRSTARHLTYVNNGGLAGCLKTVAEEREKIGKSKKGVQQEKNPQLQEMIQRAKAMAAKTIDEVKEQELPLLAKKAPQPKKNQLRSSAKKYTTVFGAAALKELRMNQNLPDVKFEGSSEEDSDEEKDKNNTQGGSNDKNMGRKLGRRLTMGR